MVQFNFETLENNWTSGRNQACSPYAPLTCRPGPICTGRSMDRIRIINRRVGREPGAPIEFS